MQWTSQRKNSRIHIAVPVRISGVDVNGHNFERDAWTLNVSPEGACLHVPKDLPVAERVHVTSEDYQFHADADVLVVWQRAFPQHAIGVRVKPGTPHTRWQAR